MTELDIKVSTTSQFLENFCPIIENIFIENHCITLSKPQIESKIYLLEYLKRQNSNLSAINAIYKNHQGYSQMDHSIGLILRNSLADTLYLFYLNFSDSFNPVLDVSFYHQEIVKLFADQAFRFVNENKINDLKTLNKFKDYVKVNANNKIERIYVKPEPNKNINVIFQSSKETKKYGAIYNYWEMYVF